MEITIAGGAKFPRRMVAVRGTPDNPMSRAEAVAKATDLIVPVIGEARCRELVARALDIEHLSDVAVLRPLLLEQE